MKTCERNANRVYEYWLVLLTLGERACHLTGPVLGFDWFCQHLANARAILLGPYWVLIGSAKTGQGACHLTGPVLSFDWFCQNLANARAILLGRSEFWLVLPTLGECACYLTGPFRVLIGSANTQRTRVTSYWARMYEKWITIPRITCAFLILIGQRVNFIRWIKLFPLFVQLGPGF